MWLDCSNQKCVLNSDYVVGLYLDGNIIIAQLHDGSKIEVGVYEDVTAAESQLKLFKSAIVNEKKLFRFFKNIT